MGKASRDKGWGPVAIVNVPIRTVPEANSRDHHHKKARRAKAQREDVKIMLVRVCVPPTDSYLVRLRSVAPRRLDDDNLASSMKAVRDAVAARLGFDDAPSSPIAWRYEQCSRGKEYSVDIWIEANPEPCPTCGADILEEWQCGSS